MAQIILVTSFKGGVGKTTVSSALAVRLNENGNKVLVCDCDLESRCLDIVLGIENQPLFNICDAVSEKCSIDSAIAKDDRFENLYFMPAPAFYPETVQLGDTSEIFTEDAVNKFIREIKKDYDYIIFDLPARPDMLYKRLMHHADRVLVVSLHTATSIRAAEKTAIAINEICEGIKTPDIKLVVNGFRMEDARNGDNIGLYDIVTKTGMQLAGVIPYDEEMVKVQEKGIPVSKYKRGRLIFWKAVCNLTKRLAGISVDLFSGIKLNGKKSDFC